MVLWLYVQEHPKVQQAVVLILKRLRRRGHGSKSHPTDGVKPGIEPVSPGLQGIGLSLTPRLLLSACVLCNKLKSGGKLKPYYPIIYFILPVHT